MATGQGSTGDQRKVARRLVDAARRGQVETVRDLLRKHPSEVDSVGDGGITALMSASVLGHTDVVELLLEAGASINKKDDEGQTALHYAVKFEEVDVVKTLLQRGAEINSVDGDGDTPLFYAIRRWNTEVIELLINHPEIDLSIKNNQGQNLLHCAIENGKVDVVKTLLQRKAEINSVDGYGDTPLFHAIRRGKTEVIELLINHPEIDLSIKNQQGQNLLHRAIENRKVDVVKKLLQRGAKINSVVDSVGDGGITALMWASYNGHTYVVQLLLEAGASINKKDDAGWSALHCAVEGREVDVVKTLLQRGAEINSVVDSVDEGGITALMWASYNGHTDVVELLLEAGASINKKDDEGRSALHWAVEGWKVDVVKTLLQRGAEINSVVDSEGVGGMTALMRASVRGHTDVVELLLEAGASINKKDDGGRSALHWAVQGGKVDVVNTLLQRGAGINSVVDSVVDGGMTALMWASVYGHTDVVQLLLEAGASINKKDDRGQSALYWAVKCGKVDVVKKLLQRGAEINSVDGDGDTPLFYAIRRGKTEVIELLINHPEIDLSIKNQQGQNVLHCAIQCGKVDVVKTLLQRGAEINSEDGDGNTPLFYAIRRGKTEVIELLINHPEIDLSIKNKKGQNLLHCAIENEKVDAVKTLLQRRAEINSEDGDGNTPLFYAIRRGSTEVIELLINHPEIDLSIKNNQGQNLLHCASENGKVNVVKTLLQRGAEINSEDGDGNTPLFYAIRFRSTEVIELLINHPDIDLSIKNKHGQNLLHCAFQYRKVDVVKTLLQRGAEINSVDRNGNTPLFHAIWFWKTEVIELLINHPEIDLSIKNKQGQYLLHCAIHCPFWARKDDPKVKQIVEKLLQAGLDVNTVDNDGNTPLHLAVKNRNKDVIEPLINHPTIDFSIKNKEGRNVLHLAVLKGINRKEVVQKMLQQGADLNSVDVNGRTALDLAKRNGDTEIIKLLIHYQEINASLKKKKGFNALHHAAIQNDVVTTERILVNHPYLKDSKIQDIFTALHIAAVNGHDQVVGLLIQKGAQLDIKDNKQQTALHMAFKESHFSTVKLLIAKGADVNSQDENGQTCLHLAIMNHSAVIVADDDSVVNLDMDISNALRTTVYNEAKQVMELLINHPKTDFSLKNKAGFNVLHLAALRGNAVAAASILGKDTRIMNAQKENCSTALHIAAVNGHDQVVALLVQKGAELNVKNKYNHTPLHMAVVKSQSSTIHQLIRGGADCNIKDQDGETCFHLAVKKYLTLTVTDSKTASPLDDAVTRLLKSKINQAKAVMEQLINHPNIDVSLKTNEGCNVLHLAARSRNVVATKIILAKHTEIIDTQDKDSFTALHLAALNGHEEMASLLIEKGAKLDVRSKNQHTPLHLAIMKSYLPIIELLLNNGADVNVEDDNGLTCLHIAVMKHAAPSLVASLPVLSSRLDKFGNKDEKTEFAIVSFLVKKGADVTIKNKDGFTAFDMITDPVKKEAFKMIVSFSI